MFLSLGSEHKNRDHKGGKKMSRDKNIKWMAMIRDFDEGKEKECEKEKERRKEKREIIHTASTWGKRQSGREEKKRKEEGSTRDDLERNTEKETERRSGR